MVTSELTFVHTHIRSMGPDGLRAVTEYAVLNANYMMRRLAPFYDLPFDRDVNMNLYYQVVVKRNLVYVH